MADSKVVAGTGRKPPPNAGKGRKKGTPNKVTKEVKEMVIGALIAKGGQAYLERQADENPAAFLGLVKAILPKDVNASVDLKGKVSIISEFPDV